MKLCVVLWLLQPQIRSGLEQEDIEDPELDAMQEELQVCQEAYVLLCVCVSVCVHTIAPPPASHLNVLCHLLQVQEKVVTASVFETRNRASQTPL